MYSPVLHVGSSMLMLGKIENHSVRPLDENEIDDLCKRLNALEEGNKEAQHSGSVADNQDAIEGDSAFSVRCSCGAVISLRLHIESSSMAHNTGSPKLLLDIDEIDRAVCNKRGFGFDIDEIMLIRDFVIPIIERQLRARA